MRRLLPLFPPFQALLVNSSILPILLQALVLALPLPLQAAVQVQREARAWGAAPRCFRLLSVVRRRHTVPQPVRRLCEPSLY